MPPKLKTICDWTLTVVCIVVGGASGAMVLLLILGLLLAAGAWAAGHL